MNLRRILLPFLTALAGGFIGPLVATFPFWIISPFVGGMAVFAGFLLAAFGGLIYGFIFSRMPVIKIRSFFEMNRVSRLSLVALYGAICGALCCLLLWLIMSFFGKPSITTGLIEEIKFWGLLLGFLTYGGAISSIVLLPIVRWTLRPELDWSTKLKGSGSHGTRLRF